MHRELFRCGHCFLWQRKFRHAVVVLGMSSRFVNFLAKRERALNIAKYPPALDVGLLHRVSVTYHWVIARGDVQRRLNSSYAVVASPRF